MSNESLAQLNLDFDEHEPCFLDSFNNELSDRV